MGPGMVNCIEFTDTAQSLATYISGMYHKKSKRCPTESTRRLGISMAIARNVLADYFIFTTLTIDDRWLEASAHTNSLQVRSDHAIKRCGW